MDGRGRVLEMEWVPRGFHLHRHSPKAIKQRWPLRFPAPREIHGVGWLGGVVYSPSLSFVVPAQTVVSRINYTAQLDDTIPFFRNFRNLKNLPPPSLPLQADKVLHEQQLGWEWRPPDDAVFTPVHSTTTTGGEGGATSGSGGEEEQDEDAAARAREQEVRRQLEGAFNSPSCSQRRCGEGLKVR